MSWNPWQSGQMSTPPSGTGQLHPAGQMPTPGQSAYTPDQLIAWQKYQQQYQQWHEKYYEQYQKEMQSKLGATTAAPTVLPSYQMITPTIISPYITQPSMSQPPPPLNTNTIRAQPPPPLLNAEPAQPPPPPPPPEGPSQNNLDTGGNSNFKSDLKSISNSSYCENFKQKSSFELPITNNSKLEVNTSYLSAVQAVSAPVFNRDQIEVTVNKRSDPHLQPATITQNIEIDKSPDEKIFDEQFRKWEEQFENWKKENVNHPDRKAYREYEMQFEEVRKKLIERRNAMLKRKLGQHHQVQQPQDAPQVKKQSRLNEIIEASTKTNISQEPSKYSKCNTTPSFYTNNCNSNNTIPGLDLVDKSFGMDENINKESYECNYSTNSIKYQRNLQSNASSFADTASDKKLDLLNKERREEGQKFINGPNNSQSNQQKKIPSLLDQKFEKPDFMDSESSFPNKNIRNKNNTRNQENSKITILSDEKVNIVKFNPLPNQNIDYSNKSNAAVLNDEKMNISKYSMLNTNNQQSQHQVIPATNPPTNNIVALANVLSDPNVMAILNAALKSNNSIDSMTQKNSHSAILTNSDCSSVHQNSDRPQFTDFLKQKQPVNRLFNPKERQYSTEVVPQMKFTESNSLDLYKNKWGDDSNCDLRTDFYSDSPRDGNSTISKFQLNQNERENFSNPFAKPLPNRDSNMEDDFYRPAQVIDYQNKSAYNRVNPFSEDLVPKKVVDYGHKPSFQTTHKNSDNSSFIPIKTIDYAHASNVIDKNLSDKKKEEIMICRRERKRIKREQMQIMKPIYESNENYPGAWSLLNAEERQRKGFPTKRGKRNKSKILAGNKDVFNKPQKNDDSRGDCNYEQDFEEISDEDEMSFNNDRSVKSQYDDDIIEIINSPTNKNNEQTSKTIFPVQMIFPTNENNNTIIIDEILLNPGRKTRPKKIVVILRGPPASGKSYVARLIKEKENDLSGAPVRLLSIDDYFMVETDRIETCPKTGRPINKKVMIYEFDEKMEEQYVEYLTKAYRKTLSDSLYDFVIIDYSNQSLRTFTEFYNTAKSYNYTPYTVDMITDFDTCSKQNDHNRNLNDIKNIIDNWKVTPTHYIKLNISSLLHKEIQVVDMADAISLSDSKKSCISNINETKTDENSESAEANNSSIFFKSKWDTDFSEEGLARLDGASKKNYQKRSTMQDYLQLEDIWEPPQSNNSSKKRVRWADIEEKKAQDKMRAIGFIVGHTDWKRMMDPTQGSSALTKTKYIDKVKKPYRK